MRGDWICNLNIIMGWKIKSLGAHGTFGVNFIVAEDIGSSRKGKNIHSGPSSVG